MAKNNKLVMIGAVVFGLLALGLTSLLMLSRGGSRPAPAAAVVAEETVAQFVAAYDIAPRTAIERSMLREERVPKNKVSPNAIMERSAVLGKLCSMPLREGQVVTTDAVIEPVTRVVPANIPVPPGLRAVAVWVDPNQTVAGLVDVGDRVDVVVNHRVQYKNISTGQTGQAVSGRTIGQDLQVLAVDRSIYASPMVGGATQPGAAATPAPTPATAANAAAPTAVRTRVILAAAPPDAERLVAANQEGTIHLTIRNPKDSPERYPIPEAIEYPVRVVDANAAERAEKLRAERREEMREARRERFELRRTALQNQGRALPQLPSIAQIPPARPVPNLPAPHASNPPFNSSLSGRVQEPVRPNEVTVIRGTEKTRVLVPSG